MSTTTPAREAVLQAAVTVRDDGSTACHLSFARGLRFQAGREAVERAIAALQAEAAESERCPAATGGKPFAERISAPVPPSREAVARTLYEHDNRKLKDVWPWDADGLEAEHPGTRERYERAADAILAEHITPLAETVAVLTVERDAANKVREMTAMSGGFYARRAENVEADRDRLASDLAAARAEIEGLRARVESALTDACRMGAILLMAGEMTAPERRAARAVANGLANKVRAVLPPARAALTSEDQHAQV